MYDLTRREALRTSGIVAGGLALGGAVASETAAADHGKAGGTMLHLSEPRLGAPFTAEETFEFEFPTSCFASESAIKGFQEIEIEYADGQQSLAAIRLNKTHFAPDGETTYALTSSQQCRDPASPTGATIWKAAFRPV